MDTSEQAILDEAPNRVARRRRSVDDLVAKEPAPTLGPRRRAPHPGMLDDQPIAVWLVSIDDYVAAFGADFGSSGDGGQSLLEVAAVIGEVAGGFKVPAVEDEVAIETGHDVLEEGAEDCGASDALSRGLEEDGIGRIELQDGFELLGAEVLNPGLADFGEGHDGGGLGGGGRGKGQCGDDQERDGGAMRSHG
jgi:hypothetical protein